MKTSLLLIIGTFLFSQASLAQFENAMTENVPAIFSADRAESLQSVIHRLERIGAAEKDRWEPFYYAAFGYLRMSGMVEKSTEKDKYLDLALDFIEKCEEKKPNHSEVVAFKGYIHMIRVSIDPATRGMRYSHLAFTSLQKAVALNPENPRAHYLLGQMQYGTAQFMGKGSDEACESFGKAKVLYENQNPKNDFTPRWGKEMNENMMDKVCSRRER